MATTTKNQTKAKKGEDTPFLAPDMINKYWELFFKSKSKDHERHGKEALQWFQRRVTKDVRGKASTLINGPASYATIDPQATKGMIGKLYLYEYEAEEAGDKESGLYDRFPMVFFFNAGRTKAGKMCLWGLNLHYLTPSQRAMLYQKLLQFKTSKRWTPDVKLKLQADLIKAAAGAAVFEKAVHAYRVDRIQSRMVEIASNDWQIAIFLSIQKWLKAKGPDDHYQTDAKRKIYKKNLAKM